MGAKESRVLALSLLKRLPSSGVGGDDVLYLEEVPGGDLAAPNYRLVRLAPDHPGRGVLLDNIDANTILSPRLSPDGKWWVYATVVIQEETRSSDLLQWLLFEPAVAQALGLQWDFFLRPADGGGGSNGGAPMRLTEVGADEPHAVWIDNSTIAVIGTKGLFTLELDRATGRPKGEPTVSVRPGGPVRRVALATRYSPGPSPDTPLSA